MNDSIPANVKSKINAFKKEYPVIYGLKIDKDFFVLRPLSRGEFSTIITLQEYMEWESDEFIFETCVLYPKVSPKDIDQMLAGTVSEVSKAVIDISGFSSVDLLQGLIQTNRDLMEMADNQITAILCKAFPQLTPDIIDEFDIYKITHYLALAEQMLGITYDIPIDKKSKKQNKNEGHINFDEDNKELFKSEVKGFMPKGDLNVKKLNGGNVG